MLSGNAFPALVFVCAVTGLAQTPVLRSIVNAASLGPELSPGGVAVVQGTGFGPDIVLHVGDVSVTPIGGSVFPTRFNAVLPSALSPGAYQATVTTGASRSAAVPLTLKVASPAFYSVTTNGDTTGAFYDEAHTRITVENGAVRGTVVTAFANGLGPADGKPPLLTASLPVRVSIRGDSGWTSVAALARQDSSLTGYWQVQFTMPEGFVQGSYDAYLSAGTIDGPAVALPAGGAILRAVVNAANPSRTAPIAPGSLVAIYGTELTPADASGLFPATTLPGGGAIRIAGILAPLWDVSATYNQAHVVVPWEVKPSDAAEVVIENSFGTSRPYRLPVAETAVGIFRLADPSNGARANAAALLAGTAWAAIPPSMAAAMRIPQNCRGNADAGTPCGQPAVAGDVLQVYCTGLGAVSPALPTGRRAPADGSTLHRAVAPPQATIGGVPAEVQFAGIAPGFAGLYQMNIVVPNGVAPGDDVPLTIVMPAGDRDTATIAVR